MLRASLWDGVVTQGLGNHCFVGIGVRVDMDQAKLFLGVTACSVGLCFKTMMAKNLSCENDIYGLI